MKKSIHVNALAAAVAIACAGGVSSHAFAAQQGQMDLAATAGDLTESAVGQYIITFAEPGLLHYSGDVQGLSATAPKTLGARKLDARSAASVAYASHLDAKRAEHVTAIESRIGRPLDISHSYGVIRNGIAASLNPDELAEVAATSGVISVKPVKLYTAETYRGPKFIGAGTIWDGTNVPGNVGAKGKGIKVGIIDMGANSAHPSFANDETCGFNSTDKKLYAFDCNTSAAGHCTGPNPEAPTGAGDVRSHGVHTASTAAGNTIDNTATPAPALPDGTTMSGVAPCATVYSYRVSDASGSLPNSAISAAIEAIVTDGMDVANFSIGPTCGGGGSPWGNDDRDFLDAIDADVFVAASAGNTRTACTDPVGRVSHTGPWMLTVAASTQDQTLGQGTFAVTGPGTVPPLLQSFGGTKGSTTEMDQVSNLTGSSLRTYPTNIAGCTATGGFPANYFQGAIAVIRRGATPPATVACNFSEKINNAASAGATMVIIANNKNDTQGMDTTGATLPSFKVNDLATSDALIAFVNANNGGPGNPDVIFANGFDPAVAGSGAVADFTKGDALVTVQGDVLGGFSFRGPTSGNVADLTKPDITGPGVNIYAAGRAADGNYLFMGGTSMSSPHVAGAAALVREVHPDWTVAEVKSVLMTTAFEGGFQEDATTPWTVDQVGSGRVDLTKAAKAGLTLDETYQRFVDANPSGGSVNVKELNIPSLRNVNCGTSCTWKRTVKNRLAVSGNWSASGTGAGFGVTVTPASFTLAPGETKELTITAAPSAPLSALAFGGVTLHEANGASPDQHLTVAVKTGTAPTGPVIAVAPTSLSSTQATDTTATKTLNVSNTGSGSLTWNFAANASGPIWDQPRAGDNGIVSDYSTVDAGGAYTAADFQVTNATQVSKIKAYGFDSSDTLAAQPSITWRIYSDAAGKPAGNPDTNTGTPVWTYTAAPTAAGVSVSDGTDETISLDLAAAGQSLNLPAGTYWLSVAPTYTNPIGPAASPRWNWFQSVQQGGPGYLIGGLFGVNDWTALQGLVQWPDVAFTIEGSVTCGAPWLSLAPNSGSTAGGATTPVTATFNSTGMANGTYTAMACIASNDTAHPVVTVPVTMTVQESGGTCTPTQLFQDPSVEQQDAFWTNTDSEFGSSFCDSTCDDTGTIAARTGDTFVWFGGSRNPGTATLAQSVVFPSGQARWLNFWLIDQLDTGASLKLTIDGTQVLNVTPGTVSQTYAAKTFEIPAQYLDGQSHNVQFNYSKTATTANPNGAMLDDITLDCSAQPTRSAPVTDPVMAALRSKMH